MVAWFVFHATLSCDGETSAFCQRLAHLSKLEVALFEGILHVADQKVDSIQ